MDDLQNRRVTSNGFFDNLKQAYALHQVIFDEANHPIDYVYLEVNEKFAQMLQWDKEKVIGTRISQLMLEGHQYWVDRFGKVAISRIPEFFTQYSQPLNAYYEIYAFSPKFGYFGVIFTDITDRVENDAKLFSERELFSRITESSQIGITIVNNKGDLTFANKEAERIFHIEKSELLKRKYNSPQWNILDFDGNPIPDEELPFRIILRERKPLHEKKHAIKTTSGEKLFLSISGAPVFDDLGEIAQIIFNIRDITPEIEQAIALRKSEDARSMLQMVIDSAEIEFFWLNSNAKFIYVNDFACRTLGYTRDELLTMGVKDIDVQFPMDKWEQNWQNTKKMRSTTLESIHKTKNGIKFPVIIHQTFLKFKENELLFAIVRDISDIKCAEEKIRDSQRLEAIGRLAGGIAHDFNNILAGILGYAQLIQLDSSASPSIIENANSILTTGERAADLVKQLLSVARKGKLKSIPLDIHSSIEETLNIFRQTMASNITIKTQLNASRSIIRGDPSQMIQMLLNIAVNAKDAMPDGGIFNISTDNLLLSQEDHAQFPDLTSSLYILISLRDTGVGIPKEVFPSLFEPFFTTKVLNKGTGLGLAVVWGIVKNHEGTIKVESELGKGTCFTIFLPVSSENEQSIQIKKDTGLIRGSGTILLVDDESFIRQTGSILLNQLGYNVLTAKNGFEAIEIYQSKGKSIDIVVLDMIMPEMDGKKCFLQLKAINPDIKVIIATGYSLDHQINELYQQGSCEYISKPFRIEQLSQLIAKCLPNQEK
jgi:PAS domain S-box-containing protein